jgi:hypothetical protein
VLAIVSDRSTFQPVIAPTLLVVNAKEALPQQIPISEFNSGALKLKAIGTRVASLRFEASGALNTTSPTTKGSVGKSGKIVLPEVLTVVKTAP